MTAVLYFSVSSTEIVISFEQFLKYFINFRSRKILEIETVKTMIGKTASHFMKKHVPFIKCFNESFKVFYLNPACLFQFLNICFEFFRVFCL